jgi:hypothetical protein
MVLRRTATGAKRPFRLGGASVIAPVAFVIGSLIVYFTGWATDSKLLIAILIGVVLYLVVSAFPSSTVERPTGQSIKSGLWMVVYLLAMLGMVYFGSSKLNELKNVIPYPLDLVVVIVLSIIFFYWGVASGFRTDDVGEAIGNVDAETSSRIV